MKKALKVFGMRMPKSDELVNIDYYPSDFDGDYDDFDEPDEFEQAMMNCGQLQDGTCMKAGSEECDWECPFSDEL